MSKPQATKDKLLELAEYITNNPELDEKRYEVKVIPPGWLKVPQVLNDSVQQKTAEQWMVVSMIYI